MDELLAFVRRCLDDDERVARQMAADPGGFYVEAETDETNIMTVGAYIYRWTPKRVLDEVKAKRRILDDYDILMSAIRRVDDVEGNRLLYARREARESDIRWLAQPFAGCEGWREEWLVSGGS